MGRAGKRSVGQTHSMRAGRGTPWSRWRCPKDGESWGSLWQGLLTDASVKNRRASMQGISAGRQKDKQTAKATCLRGQTGKRGVSRKWQCLVFFHLLGCALAGCPVD